MNKLIDFDTIARRNALDRWLEECRRRMGLRFPKIEFDAAHWPVKTLYQTAQMDWHFAATTAEFAAKDQSYNDVARCLVAEMMIKGTPKLMLKPMMGFRRLAATSAASIFDLTVSDLSALESVRMKHCEQHPASAKLLLSELISLAVQLRLIASKNVIPHLGYNLNAQVRARLCVLAKAPRSGGPSKNGDLLDRQMEALNEAVNAMLDDDPRLNPMDRVALCTAVRALCAPSRINEQLCCSIDDHVTVDDYGQQDSGTWNKTYRAHQLLLVTMKGSKGAQWSAKPALTFMIDAFHYTSEEIRKHGQRSRMLVDWYQAHPTTLYLPPKLEYLRGQALCVQDLAKIINTGETALRTAGKQEASAIFKFFGDRRFKAPNPNSHNVHGQKTPQKFIYFLPWVDVENYLLRKVHLAMADCRKVTRSNHYQGDLSKMLFLFDGDESTYLPFALEYQAIRNRLKRTKARTKIDAPPSLFEKLGITIPVDGNIQTAEIETHDPRRWLTTMALRHGEKLSDVLINKWANRSSLAQLKAYDFRTPEELATFSRMPEPPELKDLSSGLEKMRKLEDTYGLKSDIVVAHDAGITVTSLDSVLKAVQDRPIAKTSEQIIIIYPTRYGVCLHQHHETPCRRYDICITCNENCCVKGYRPSNDTIREEETKAAMSIIRQLEKLVTVLNRGLADHPDTFMEHLALLVGRGLCPKQMADHLIAEFHEIKDQIRDKLLRKRLEEAFVARSYVRMLDDDGVADGALMKYHNPKQHAAPGLEMALDTHGGREKVASDEQALIAKFPVFSPTALELQDQRHLIEPEDDEERK